MRTRPSRLLRPSRNCPHQCSQSSPPRAAARTTRRWRASSACSRRSSGTAGTGRTGPPPASSRSSGARSVDTIRRGAAMCSVAARRLSSAPRWEGPRNGPRNRPQSPFLPLWDSFLLGRACPKPCWMISLLVVAILLICPFKSRFIVYDKFITFSIFHGNCCNRNDHLAP